MIVVRCGVFLGTPARSACIGRGDVIACHLCCPVHGHVQDRDRAIYPTQVGWVQRLLQVNLSAGDAASGTTRWNLIHPCSRGSAQFHFVRHPRTCVQIVRRSGMSSYF